MSELKTTDARWSTFYLDREGKLIGMRPASDCMYRALWPSRLGCRPHGKFDPTITHANESNGRKWRRIWWRFYWLEES